MSHKTKLRKKCIIGVKVGLILFSILKIFHIIRVKLILETANYSMGPILELCHMFDFIHIYMIFWHQNICRVACKKLQGSGIHSRFQPRLRRQGRYTWFLRISGGTGSVPYPVLQSPRYQVANPGLDGLSATVPGI